MIPAFFKDYPGNEHAFEELKKVLQSGKAIAFVGAGASAGLYPLWGQLIQLLADQAVAEGLAQDSDREYWLNLGEKDALQVASLIKKRFDEPTFLALIRETFGPRRTADDRFFSQTHELILRLPFRGLITTNYDSCLVEARAKLRQDVPHTGFATWKDQLTVYRWHTGAIFEDGSLPILFAHGSHDREESIVLTIEDYQNAYGPGLYRRTFDGLWGQCSLVFLGFGFSDPYLGFLSEKVTYELNAPTRHIAFVGMDELDKYSSDSRRLFQKKYGLKPIFYPVRTNHDHGALSELLTALGPVAAPIADPSPTIAPLKSPKVAEKWVHETTDDDRYTGRTDELAKLDRWSRDPEVHAIAVTGMGGLGKTSLIGHWLKRAGGLSSRRYEGMFFWSFYAERSVSAFLKELLRFLTQEMEFKSGPTTELVDAVIACLRQNSVCLVLDGLELIQEHPGETSYGALLEPALSRLIDRLCRKHKGSAILTSRFPFPDLTRHVGRGLRTMALTGLSDAEGAQLLERLGVEGQEKERITANSRLEGHPIGLRLFARTVAAQADGDPNHRIQLAFDQAALNTDEPLAAKIQRLLQFYEDAMAPGNADLLSLVALFFTPVPADTLQTLVNRIDPPSLRRNMDHEALCQRLDAMAGEGILLREPKAAGYSCHPILRDHFRKRLFGVAAGHAVDLLMARPATDEITDIAQLTPVLDAIALLIDSGDLNRANELYVRHTIADKTIANNTATKPIFLTLPAARAGLECTRRFVRDDLQIDRLKEQCGSRIVGFFLNMCGLLADDAGYTRESIAYYNKSTEWERSTHDKINLSVALQGIGHLNARLGNYISAEGELKEALSLVPDDPLQIITSTSILGDSLSMMGRIGEALLAFELANDLRNKINRDHLIGYVGTLWTSLLIRLGARIRALRLGQANLKFCVGKTWFRDAALCKAQVARLILDPNSSLKLLRDSEEALRKGQMIRDLPGTLVALADRLRLDHRFDEATAHAEEAIDIAAPRGHRPFQADGLVARGRTRLEMARGAKGESKTRFAELALDDGQQARQVAASCPYPWATRDAYQLIADAWQVLKEVTKSNEAGIEADALRKKLVLPYDYVFPKATCWRGLDHRTIDGKPPKKKPSKYKPTRVG